MSRCIRGLVVYLQVTCGLILPAAAQGNLGHHPDAQYTIIDAKGDKKTQGTDLYGITDNDVSVGTAYSYSFLRTPDGTYAKFGKNVVVPEAMNNLEQVTGRYLSGNDQGFLYQPGARLQRFHCPHSKIGETEAVSINNNGDIAGWCSDGSTNWGFIRSSGGQLTTFLPPDGGHLWGLSAQAINDVGSTVGYFADKFGAVHAFARSAAGNFVPFDAPDADEVDPNKGTYAQSINQAGWIFGYYIDAANNEHGFISDPSLNITEFDLPQWGDFITDFPQTMKINDNQTIVATYEDVSGLSHGLIRASDGTITDFQAPGAGPRGTFAVAINNSDVVVGWVVDKRGRDHGFIRTP